MARDLEAALRQVDAIRRKAETLAAEIIGDDALKSPKLNGDRGGDERWVNQMLGSLGQAISGGTSNIQRNIISERGLGLPRDGKEP